MLITTEGFEEGSRVVTADEVPVKMIGSKYDFAGRGLRLRWNDKDGRLDLLEIAHGEQLVVKDSSALSGTFGNGGTKKTTQPASLLPTAITLPPPPLTSMLAANDKASTGSVLRSERKPKTTAAHDTPAVPIPYVATFLDHINISQGLEILVTADRMDVDFTTRKEQSAPSAAQTKPATNPETQPWMRPVDTSNGSRKSPASTTRSSSVDHGHTSSPSTRPAPPPVVIRWTGMLRMVPARDDRSKVAAGDATVELNGNPVRVRRTAAGQQEGDDIRAARLVYHTGDGSVKLINSIPFPEVVISKLVNGTIDPKTSVTTGTLDYGIDAAGKKFALLTGYGHAAVPMESGAAKNAPPAQRGNDMMDAHWSKSAKVYFSGKGQDDLSVEHVDLLGDVDIRHPQLLMQSQAVSLFFEPTVKPAKSPATLPTTNPAHSKQSSQQIRQVLASDAVHCEILGQNGKKQTIDSNILDVHTARTKEGKFYARQVDASGAVHAFDSEQDLRADTVELTLRPIKPTPKVVAHFIKPCQPVHSASRPADPAGKGYFRCGGR